MKNSYPPSIISFTTARLMMDFAAATLINYNFPEIEYEDAVKVIKEFFPEFCDRYGIKGVIAYDKGKNNWDNE